MNRNVKSVKLCAKVHAEVQPLSRARAEPLLLSGGEEIDAAAEAAALAPVSIARQKRRQRNRMSARFRTQPVTFEEIKEVDEEQQQQQHQQQQQQQELSVDEAKINESRRGSALTRSLDNLQQQHQKEFQTVVDVDCSGNNDSSGNNNSSDNKNDNSSSKNGAQQLDDVAKG